MVCRVTDDPAPAAPGPAASAPAGPAPASTALLPATSASAPQASRPLTFGLVGTGHWAKVAHARALASVPDVKFAAIWGRNTEAAAGLATEFGLTAHADFDAFLAEIDAVAFSVAPDAQSEL